MPGQEAFLKQGVERCHRGDLCIDLEKAAQVFARIAAAEPVCAQGQ